MKIAEVKKLTKRQRFVYWITEREAIRKKKENNEIRPWTDDEILATYRFCNVRRMDDKVSKWLDRYWYRQYQDHRNIVAGVALARFFNLPSTLEVIQPSIFRDSDPLWKTIIGQVRKLKKVQAVFNGAYIVRGNDGEDKIDSVVTYYVKPLFERFRKIEGVWTDTMEGCWREISCSFGFGSFMAGQVTADLRHAVTGEWRDKYEWAPVGPGSARGLARLLYADEDWANVAKDFANNPEAWLSDFREHVLEDIASEVPIEISRRLEAHDYQNCLCEYDKYSRALQQEGKPKQRYTPES